MADIKYNNKDFGDFRRALINHAKNYFPDTYSDFNESSPGMMFIEMSAMIGDVLSFYNDKQLQESFINMAFEKKNIYNLAQNYGYKPNTIVPAQVNIDFMQLVPAKLVGGEYEPNMDYALHIKSGAQIGTQENIRFRTIEPVDFNINTKSSPITVSIYEIANDGEITYFQLTKSVKAVSGAISTSEYVFTDPKKYDKIVIDESGVSEIIEIIDSEENKWYEVNYLSQDLIPISVRNTSFNDTELSQYNSTVPYLLCYSQTDRRYVIRLRNDDKYEIQFGAGLNLESDEEILPNPFNVGIGIDYFKRSEDVSIDPQNFLNTKTYGTAPTDTTLTVTYSKANGLIDNVKSDSITIIDDIEFVDNNNSIDETILNLIKTDAERGLKITNPQPAYGGLNQKPLDVIREEAISHFAAQNRAVTKADYILRAYNMPSKYGALAKAYIEQDEQLSNNTNHNPYALDLHVLSYDEDGTFIIANDAIKENLRRYLMEYRLMTDAINIRDAFIINIGISFEIITRPNSNSYEVITKCIARLKELFSQQYMEINKSIILSKLYAELDQIEGVQTVSSIAIENLYDSDSGYSGNLYDIKSATRNGIIYPSLDPSIFEVKFPDADIKGRVIDL